MKKFCLVAALAAGFAAGAQASSLWTGRALTGDWGDAANWSGGVPAANGEACFYRPTGTNFVLSVTPPASFTGTVVVSNNLAGASGESYLNSRFHLMLSLGGAEGAQWKVKGNGHLVATAGLAARIDPSFAGLVEVRKDVAFAAPATLGANVAFIGAGELALASTAQLPQARAFAGRVILPGGDVVVKDTGLLADRDLTLADGQTLTLDAADMAFGTIRRFDFAHDAGQWSYNGTAWRVGTLPTGPYSPEPPYVREDGVLMLTDDPAQVHTVWYTNRLFRATDDVGASFTWTPNLPADSRIVKAGRRQVQSGNLSIVFQSVSPTNVILPTSPTQAMERNNQATKCWGLTMYTYGGEQNAHWSWIVNGSKPGLTESLRDRTTEISLAKPIDFTVHLSKGVMTVTMVQGGKSMSLRHDFRTAFEVLNAGGMYFGLGGSSDTWGDSDASVATPWIRHEISGFRGWYRDPLEGGWEPIADEEKYTTFNETNWDIKRHVSNGNGRSSHDTLTGNACLDADGGFSILPTDYYAQTTAFSRSTVPKNKPLRYAMEFDSTANLPKGNWQGMSFMPLGSNNGVDGWDGYANSGAGWKFFSSGVGGCLYGFAFQWNIYNGSGEWTYGWVFGKTEIPATRTNVVGPTYAAGAVSRTDSGRGATPKDVRYDFIYDPRGTFTQILSTDPANTANSANGGCFEGAFQVPAGWMEGFEKWKTERSSVIGFRGQCASTDIYTLKFRKFRLLQMTSAQAGDFAGRICVPSGAAASVAAGGLMDGQTAEVVSFGTAELATGATLSVKPAGAATKVSVAKVVSAGDATLAATAGAEVRVGEIELTGAGTGTGLALDGAVTLGDALTLTVPAGWRDTRPASVTVVDASGATGGFALAPADVVVRDADGALPSGKYTLSVRSNRLVISFAQGTCILFR